MQDTNINTIREVIQPNPNFRYTAVNVFLTYPQSNFTFQELYDFINNAFAIHSAIICREPHEDGNMHIHACIKFKNKINVKNVNKFDFQGRHPNLGKIRNWDAACNYCRKESDFQEWNLSNQSFAIYTQVSDFSDRKEFFQKCVDKKIPFQYAKDAWDSNLKLLNTINEDTPILGTITSENLRNFTMPTERKSLWIKGTTGIGKTTWAKKNAKKPSLFIRHMDQLRYFQPGFHQSLIFDDMSFLHLPREAQIHILDQDDVSALHLRNVIATIPPGTQKIFLSNIDIFDTSDPAIDRRVRCHIFKN